ncbi:hypothetical protein EON81_03035 [bacterium]|nr:MAG: hypothetical protein EON81_03035 [bacterium]
MIPVILLLLTSMQAAEVGLLRDSSVWEYEGPGWTHRVELRKAGTERSDVYFEVLSRFHTPEFDATKTNLVRQNRETRTVTFVREIASPRQVAGEARGLARLLAGRGYPPLAEIPPAEAASAVLVPGKIGVGSLLRTSIDFTPVAARTVTGIRVSGATTVLTCEADLSGARAVESFDPGSANLLDGSTIWNARPGLQSAFRLTRFTPGYVAN